MTVEENIRAADPDADISKVNEMLTLAELKDVRRQPGGLLSGGERRKTEIVRILALPKVKALILDEPFASLDPAMTAVMKRLLLAMARRKRISIIMADHSARDVMSVSDECLLLAKGRQIVKKAPWGLARNAVARNIFLGPDFAAPRKIKLD